MRPVSIGSIVVGSVCRAVALLHGFIFFRRLDLKADLWFALMAVGVAVTLTAMCSLLGIVDPPILLNYTSFGLIGVMSSCLSGDVGRASILPWGSRPMSHVGVLPWR